MKKIVKLLLLFVVPLLFVACSDEYEDLLIPGRSINGTVKVGGYVYKKDGTWYLSSNLNPFLNLNPQREATEIKFRDIFSEEALENLLKLDYGGHKFIVKLILYRVEYDKPLPPYQENIGTIYYYIADLYGIDYV